MALPADANKYGFIFLLATTWTNTHESYIKYDITRKKVIYHKHDILFHSAVNFKITHRGSEVSATVFTVFTDGTYRNELLDSVEVLNNRHHLIFLFIFQNWNESSMVVESNEIQDMSLITGSLIDVPSEISHPISSPVSYIGNAVHMTATTFCT